MSQWTKHSLLLLVLLRLFLIREKAMLRKKSVHGESIIPGDFKSFAWGKCDFAKAYFEEGWRLWAIFRFYLPLPPAVPLFLSSSPLSILLLFWGGLFSPLKHPCAHRYYWALTIHLNTSLCVCVCQSLSEREQGRWSDLAWQTVL